MSNSDKNAIIALVALLYIAEKYAGIEAKEYMFYVNKVIDAYVPNNPVNDKELDNMRSRLDLIDNRISALNYDSSITLTMAIGIMVSENYLSFVKNPVKRSSWIQLHNFCNTNQLIKHSLRQQIFQELDKVDVISSIITNI